MTKTTQGRFIAFEGQDGVGKSTAIKRVAEQLRSLGHEVLEVREPGGTEAGERIRDLLKSDVPQEPRTEALLFAAARAQIVAEVIRPALERGAVVLSDRFVLSSLAYQGVGRGLGVAEVWSINEFALGDLRPDRTLFLELSPEESERRLRDREADGETVQDRFEESDFQRRVQTAYVGLASTEDGVSRVLADGTREEVGARCLDALQDLFDLPADTAGSPA